MKAYLLLLSLLFVSCASKKVYVEKKSHKDFKPYIVNYKLNYEYSKTALKNVKREIPINYSKKHVGVVGYCVLNENVNDREVYVNPLAWDNPENFNKRESYIVHLLNLCYMTNFNESPHYEIYYYGY